MYSASTSARRLGTTRIVNLLWLFGTLVLALIALIHLLGRLGLPGELIGAIWLVGLALAVLSLVWIGRTMTGTYYFFAGRRARAPVSGFSGGSDWLCGSLLLLIIMAAASMQLLMALGVMLGLAICALLVAPGLHRSGRATLPGFFDWRFPGTGCGLAALVPVLAFLVLLGIAEFSLLRDLVAVVGPITPGLAVTGLLIAALLPVLFGGWFALLAVNVVFAMAVIVAVTVPTLYIGLFADPASLTETTTFSPLPALASGGGSGLLPTLVPGQLALMLAIAGGIAVSPLGLARLALVARPNAASEHVGWAALFVFIVFSALPLSLTLITQSAQQGLGLSLAAIPALHYLPYIALLLAAFNAFSATLMTLSSTLVRAFRRTQKRDPDDRTMFGTRLLATLFVLALGWLLADARVSSLDSLLCALMIASSGLLAPTLVSLTVRCQSGRAVAVAIIVGAAFPLALISFGEGGFMAPPVWSVMAGWACSAIVLSIGHMVARRSGEDAASEASHAANVLHGPRSR